MHKIIKNKDLAEILSKNPDDYIIVGKYGDEIGHYDQKILNVFRRDINNMPTTVINIENFSSNGMLKFYSKT